MAWQPTGVPSTALMSSPLRSRPAAGSPFTVLVMVSTMVNLIPSWHSAAAVAVCWELTISSVSCLLACCEVSPAGKELLLRHDRVVGLSQARSASKTLNGGRAPGPPM